FSSRRRHTSFSRDWSSDVCSSDLMNRCNLWHFLTPLGSGRGRNQPYNATCTCSILPITSLIYGGLQRLWLRVTLQQHASFLIHRATNLSPGGTATCTAPRQGIRFGGSAGAKQSLAPNHADASPIEQTAGNGSNFYRRPRRQAAGSARDAADAGSRRCGGGLPPASRAWRNAREQGRAYAGTGIRSERFRGAALQLSRCRRERGSI